MLELDGIVRRGIVVCLLGLGVLGTSVRAQICHSNQDPHRKLFGNERGACHTTSLWRIPEYRHPSTLSIDCAQRHQAPPSHYTTHFQMASMTVTRVEDADVSQCFLCHKTHSRNHIKAVVWYRITDHFCLT